MRAFGVKHKCDTCNGAGRTFSIGHYSSPACPDCHGLGYILYTDRPDKVDVLICSRILPLSDFPGIDQLLNEGEPMSNTADQSEFIPLSDIEVLSIYLGRQALAKALAETPGVRETVVDHVKGTKKFVAISTDVTAKMACDAIHNLDELLEAYGYKDGRKQN